MNGPYSPSQASGNRGSKSEMSKSLRRLENARNRNTNKQVLEDDDDIIAIPLTVKTESTGVFQIREDKATSRIKNSVTKQKKQGMLASLNARQGRLSSEDEGVLPAPFFEEDGSLINRVYPISYERRVARQNRPRLALRGNFVSSFL